MKRLLSLFFCVLCTSMLFAGVQFSRSQSSSVTQSIGTEVKSSAPSMPEKSDDLFIPSWLHGTYRGSWGTFTASDNNLVYDGDTKALGLDDFFPGLTHVDFSSLLARGNVALKERHFFSRVWLTLYTENGNITLMLRKEDHGIVVQKGSLLYKQSTTDNSVSVYKSKEEGTVGFFASVQ